MPFKVEISTETFHIIAPDGTLSDRANFGSSATLDWNGNRYTCFLLDTDLENGEEPVVERVVSVEPELTTYEEVVFDDEQEEEETDEDEEEEEEEEEGEPSGDTIQG